ncbi:Alpha-1,6-mannosylglycoprotein 6-beta-N-acetylglucosaminyltransferase B [Acipenser ruthenus]|uniref:Alpha-1,6-mannosylglycoprotein 6-beta-N-acetylglucosaminyltransferase B n=1 Tax=Acipenser ruthenus TaxID=7906 RepID=A0A444UZ98_ACIRT|nr:Alpha-1,6-mannosylglycoprotein 6-beta-N-acetylglucosaminyltransferase B [Acipenser ruthenus]
MLTLCTERIFVVGIGFFSLCFLMTSLGGQFSAKRLGDSPFTIRAEVLGGLESRGVLRKISDMLEVIMKRIDSLSKRDNMSDTRILDELSSAIDRLLFASDSCPGALNLGSTAILIGPDSTWSPRSYK